MIQSARVRRLNDRRPTAGDYLLYWMQQSQRASFNPALEYAIGAANRENLPVVVGFGLTDAYAEANRRHYAFMLQGLQEVERTLTARGIGFVIRRGEPPDVAIEMAGRAAFVVCDRGYLRHQKRWRAAVAAAAPCPVVEIEGDVVVPVEEASDRHEVAARTLRPKLHRLWDGYLTPLEETAVKRDAKKLRLRSDVDLTDVDRALDRLKIDGSVAPVRRFRGGAGAARARLARFLQRGLAGYAEHRSEPGAFQCSQLSPYLHFGQISPVEIALAVRAAGTDAADDRRAYLEELIVRRELSMNFVNFNERYDSYDCLPDWAQRTLRTHHEDRREHRYSAQQLERADTHDRYWNAAMSEMVHTGYMHNYMRMYWAKKILEWTPEPAAAFRTTLYLNNKYFLDGRDANSYANVAWAFGLHDRPWPERPVFGQVRCMNARGLERKFDMAAYLSAVDHLVAAERR
jgi:deoxyribodipyrimidine photo-lyase